MIKPLSAFILLLSTLWLQAQQQPVLKNKRGIAILPQKGNYSIGIAANPFLNYFGNMFNNSTVNNAPGFNTSAPNQMIFAKYMITAQQAYRASFRIGLNSNSLYTNVADVSPGAAQNATVSDVQKQRNTFIGLSLGKEFRRGQTRMQGYYGADAFINFSSSKTLYEYGNKLENLDTGTIRVKKITAASMFSIGLRAFAGVEYFIAPNFSIGGELGYGPSMQFYSAAQQVTEQYDFSTAAAIDEGKQLSPRSQGFSLDMDKPGGIIKMLLYF